MSRDWEASHALRVQSKDLREDLEGHVPVQLGVTGTIDLTHAAFTQFLRNFVVGDDLTDQPDPPIVNRQSTIVNAVATPKARGV